MDMSLQLLEQLLFNAAVGTLAGESLKGVIKVIGKIRQSPETKGQRGKTPWRCPENPRRRTNRPGVAKRISPDQSTVSANTHGEWTQYRLCNSHSGSGDIKL